MFNKPIIQLADATDDIDVYQEQKEEVVQIHIEQPQNND